MPTMKLTQRAIEKLRAPDPSGRQTIYWDTGDHTGLGVLVSGTTTTKSWVCQAKLKTGQTRRMTIGPLPLFGIEEAWEAARVHLAAIHLGNDPKVTRARAALKAATVAETLKAFLDASPNLAAKSRAGYLASARQHLAPWLNLALRDVSGDMVEDRHRAIVRDVKARHAAGLIHGVNVDGRASSNGALRLFRALWNFASERDPDLPRNPCRRLHRSWHKLAVRTRHVPADRLAEFYTAVRGLPSEIQRDLIVFTMFTGMRSNEAAGLRWDEVDFTHGMLHIPAPRMKARRALDLPMSDVVHRLLVARRAYGRDGSYVFPGSGSRGYTQAFGFALRQIAATHGIKVSPHDLRRSFASVAAATEISPTALKILIAHTTGGDVTSGYVTLPQAELRRAVQKVCDKLKLLCGIGEVEGVVKLHA